MSADFKLALIVGCLVGLLALGHYILKRLDRIIELLERRDR